MSKTPAVVSRRAWTEPPVLWVTAPLAAALAAYCWHLWPEWSRNPDLSHGFFTPLVFVLLIVESRARGTPRWLPAGPAWRTGVTVLSLGAFILFAVAGLLAASVGWTHSLVEFVLAAALVGALLAGLLCLAAEDIRLIPLNWISLTAAGLWLLSAPLPAGTYARLTMHLQEMVTTNVLHALHFLGIPARQFGNIIQLAGTSVGIEEACSGIRSLLSCLYAGFFFAAWQVRSTAGRALLIVAAPLLAIVMNFIRSLSLTLMANAGVNIGGFWHDATGYAIMGLTAGLLALFALALSPSGHPNPPGPASPETPVPPAAGPCRWFGTTALGVAALALVFAFYGRSTPSPAADMHDIAALLPAEPAGWRVRTTGNLYQFSDILRTTQLAERSYLKEIGGQPVLVTVYVAHWTPGQAPVSLVASHTPDACWPGAGWTPVPNAVPHMTLTLDGRTLPVAEHRVFQSGTNPPEQVWFWHVYDGRVINYRDPYSVPALLELALRYGFRREGGQYFIRLSSNATWDVLAREPLIRQLFTNLAPTGLAP
ncbi:MAG: exosortase/archaeosortase family protein [Opitutales bacterium]